MHRSWAFSLLNPHNFRQKNKLFDTFSNFKASLSKIHIPTSMNNLTNILKITRKQSILTNEVLFLEAKANYTIIYLADGKSILAAATLKIFENRLPKTTFCRPNKSFIIHRDFIERINYQEKIIILKNALIIQASRRKAPLILKMVDPLNNLN